MLSHTVSDQKVTISIPTRAPSLFQLLESRADWATTQTKTKTARGAVLSLLHFRRQCDRILAARAALLPRVTKGLIDLGLRQKSSSTTLRDKPEVDWLRACMVFAGGIAIYTASQELVSPRAGSFFNVDLRGDIDRQMAAAEAAAMKEGRMAPEGQSSATAPKHTWWWRLAHWRKEAQPATPSGLGDSSNRVKLPSPSSMV